MKIEEAIEQSKEFTLYCKVRSIKRTPLGYSYYVFENLDWIKRDYKYITLVRFPNWDCPELKEEDTGFVVMKIVSAGKDTWYDNKLDTFFKYHCSQNIFLNFIFDKPQLEDQIYTVD